MIQPLFNGMLAILLTKFALNDVPHALLKNLEDGQVNWATLTFGKEDRVNRAKEILKPFLVREGIDASLDIVDTEEMFPRVAPAGGAFGHSNSYPGFTIYIQDTPLRREVAVAVAVLAHEMAHYRHWLADPVRFDELAMSPRYDELFEECAAEIDGLEIIKGWGSEYLIETYIRQAYWTLRFYRRMRSSPGILKLLDDTKKTIQEWDIKRKGMR